MTQPQRNELLGTTGESGEFQAIVIDLDDSSEESGYSEDEQEAPVHRSQVETHKKPPVALKQEKIASSWADEVVEPSPVPDVTAKREPLRKPKNETGRWVHDKFQEHSDDEKPERKSRKPKPRKQKPAVDKTSDECISFQLRDLKVTVKKHVQDEKDQRKGNVQDEKDQRKGNVQDEKEQQKRNAQDESKSDEKELKFTKSEEKGQKKKHIQDDKERFKRNGQDGQKGQKHVQVDKEIPKNETKMAKTPSQMTRNSSQTSHESVIPAEPQEPVEPPRRPQLSEKAKLQVLASIERKQKRVVSNQIKIPDPVVKEDLPIVEPAPKPTKPAKRVTADAPEFIPSGMPLGVDNTMLPVQPKMTNSRHYVLMTENGLMVPANYMYAQPFYGNFDPSSNMPNFGQVSYNYYSTYGYPQGQKTPKSNPKKATLKESKQ